MTESGIVVVEGNPHADRRVSRTVLRRLTALRKSPMEQQVLAWITHYGYLAIFLLLVFGIVGLPVPDETLLTFTGYLVFKGHLSLPLAFATALAGSACGITHQLHPGAHLRHHS